MKQSVNKFNPIKLFLNLCESNILISKVRKIISTNQFILVERPSPLISTIKSLKNTFVTKIFSKDIKKITLIILPPELATITRKNNPTVTIGISLYSVMKIFNSINNLHLFKKIGNDQETYIIFV